LPGGDVFTGLPAAKAGGPRSIGGHITVGVTVRKVVAVGHGLAVPLGGGAQGGVPAQRPCGGEALSATHPRFGPCRVDLCQQCLADGSRVADLTVEYRLRQHHLPLRSAATDADVRVLAIQQRPAVIVLQPVKGFIGILRTDHPNASNRHRRIAGSLQPIAQTTAIADGQRQVRVQRQRRQALCRAPVATLRMGTVIVDRGHQLAFAAGMGRGGQ